MTLSHHWSLLANGSPVGMRIPRCDLPRGVWQRQTHWLQRKLSFWRLLVQPAMIISSKWIYFVSVQGKSNSSPRHYGDVIMDAIASQIICLTIVYSTVYSDTDERKHQSSASLAFVRGPVNSPHKWPVARKMFPFDDVIMVYEIPQTRYNGTFVFTCI